VPPDFVGATVCVVVSPGPTECEYPGVPHSPGVGVRYSGLRWSGSPCGRKSGTYGVRTFRCGPQRAGSAEAVNPDVLTRVMGGPATSLCSQGIAVCRWLASNARAEIIAVGRRPRRAACSSRPWCRSLQGSADCHELLPEGAGVPHMNDLTMSASGIGELATDMSARLRDMTVPVHLSWDCRTYRVRQLGGASANRGSRRSEGRCR